MTIKSLRIVNIILALVNSGFGILDLYVGNYGLALFSFSLAGLCTFIAVRQ